MEVSHNVFDTFRNNLLSLEDAESIPHNEWRELESLESLSSFSTVGRDCVEIIRRAVPLLKLIFEPSARLNIISAIIREMAIKYNG